MAGGGTCAPRSELSLLSEAVRSPLLRRIRSTFVSLFDLLTLGSAESRSAVARPRSSWPSRAATPFVVAGGLEEEAAGVAEQVVPVGVKLCAHRLLLLATHARPVDPLPTLPLDAWLHASRRPETESILRRRRSATIGQMTSGTDARPETNGAALAVDEAVGLLSATSKRSRLSRSRRSQRQPTWRSGPRTLSPRNVETLKRCPTAGTALRVLVAIPPKCDNCALRHEQSELLLAAAGALRSSLGGGSAGSGDLSDARSLGR